MNDPAVPGGPARLPRLREVAERDRKGGHIFRGYHRLRCWGAEDLTIRDSEEAVTPCGIHVHVAAVSNGVAVATLMACGKITAFGMRLE
jgi:hypothetical protein